MFLFLTSISFRLLSQLSTDAAEMRQETLLYSKTKKNAFLHTLNLAFVGQ